MTLTRIGQERTKKKKKDKKADKEKKKKAPKASGIGAGAMMKKMKEVRVSARGFG